jgi:hypothetical protein
MNVLICLRRFQRVVCIDPGSKSITLAGTSNQQWYFTLIFSKSLTPCLVIEAGKSELEQFTLDETKKKSQECSKRGNDFLDCLLVVEHFVFLVGELMNFH